MSTNSGCWNNVAKVQSGSFESKNGSGKKKHGSSHHDDNDDSSSAKH